VPKKTPKLIAKNRQSLKNLNKAAGKDYREAQREVLSDANDDPHQES